MMIISILISMFFDVVFFIAGYNQGKESVFHVIDKSYEDGYDSGYKDGYDACNEWYKKDE